MTAQITGVFANECHWPLARAVNPISRMYCDADMRTEMSRHGPDVFRYRGTQGEVVIAEGVMTHPGRLWERP